MVSHLGDSLVWKFIFATFMLLTSLCSFSKELNREEILKDSLIHMFKGEKNGGFHTITPTWLKISSQNTYKMLPSRASKGRKLQHISITYQGREGKYSCIPWRKGCVMDNVLKIDIITCSISDMSSTNWQRDIIDWPIFYHLSSIQSILRKIIFKQHSETSVSINIHTLKQHKKKLC